MDDESRKKDELKKLVEADFEDGFIEREKCCACTQNAWKHRAIFWGKNTLALATGLGVSTLLRYILSTKDKNHDAIIFGHTDGATLSLTDVSGCVITLIFCSVWIRPSPTPFTEVCRSLKMVGRATIRNAIPLLCALATVFITKLVDYKINDDDHVIHNSNHHRILEISDFIGSFLLLTAFHGLDRLLERFWPVNANDDPHFGRNGVPLETSQHGVFDRHNTHGFSSNSNNRATARGCYR